MVGFSIFMFSFPGCDILNLKMEVDGSDGFPFQLGDF